MADPHPALPQKGSELSTAGAGEIRLDEGLLVRHAIDAEVDTIRPSQPDAIGIAQGRQMVDANRPFGEVERLCHRALDTRGRCDDDVPAGATYLDDRRAGRVEAHECA